MTTPSTTAEGLRAALVDRLTRDGFLTDPAWRAAFAAVPREVFVPHFFVPCRGRPGWRLIEADSEWQEGVYSNDALVTQLACDDRAAEAARRGETVEGLPTSSSSAPSLMAVMLHALDVRDGMAVLEAGTGSGYNAALLAERLGDALVTTLEVDATVADQARNSLAAAGYHPTVVASDATVGHSADTRYDRVISTVALPRVPPAWLAQTRLGALLCVPLVFAGRGGLIALLQRDQHGKASGRFLYQYGGFMATRGTPLPAAPKIRPGLLATARPTSVPVAALTDRHEAAFYLALRCGCPFTTLGFTPDHDNTGLQTWGHGADGSVFALTTVDGETNAAAEGPLWRAIEVAYAEWLDLGQPDRTRFGVTASSEDQWAWFDDPAYRVHTLSTQAS